MAKVKIKVNPLYPAGTIGDEITGLTFTKDEWTEVNGTDWKRLKESTGRQWNGTLGIPKFIEEGSDWEVKEVSQTDLSEDNDDKSSDEVEDTVSEEDWFSEEE
tara:strand:- start:8997 stop:9305 length:309 start_codon:yes stop_codon:yes gene_type:complete